MHATTINQILLFQHKLPILLKPYEFLIGSPVKATVDGIGRICRNPVAQIPYTQGDSHSVE